MKKFKPSKKQIIIGIIAFTLIFGGGITAGYFYFNQAPSNQQAEQTQNKHHSFIGEIYDKIQEYYWEEVSDESLSNIFKLGAEKITGEPQELMQKNKQGVLSLFDKTTQGMDEEKKNAFAVQLSNIVLVNLKPFKRSGLFTQKQEEELKNKVQNVNPETDLYASLGLEKGAAQEEIDKAYKEKTEPLKNKGTEEAKQELKELDYAYNVLSNNQAKEIYDSSGTEPTILANLISPNILHLYMKRVSPTSVHDLKRVTEEYDKGEKLDTLILDLRKNIGGSLDILPYLLGPFIGNNQYAFELFQQGNHEPFKTKLGWLPSLVRYKKVVILTDKNTQSSAEVMAATLKKYNVGVLVGETTKGWGTIEKVYQIENQIDPEQKYSMFLVNHLTLRDDNQPIEGNGVDPLININDSNWKELLYKYFNSQRIVNVVEDIWNTPPEEL
ncbi:MAG: DnaJ domain-containing protein [Candidatus Portnoybacteria bacterium]|nr:DnaJ domain-containing protein [Candidatus Portnoybacteria bacterium]